MGSRSNRRNMPSSNRYNFEKSSKGANLAKFSPPSNYRNPKEQFNSKLSGRPEKYNDLSMSQSIEEFGGSYVNQYQSSEKSPTRNRRGSLHKNLRKSRSPRASRSSHRSRSPRYRNDRNKRSRPSQHRRPSIELRKSSPHYNENYYVSPEVNVHDELLHDQDDRNYNLQQSNRPVQIQEREQPDNFPSNSGYLSMNSLPSHNLPEPVEIHAGNVNNQFNTACLSVQPNFVLENPFSGVIYQQNQDEDNETSVIPEFNPETSKLSSEEWMDLIEEVGLNKNWSEDDKQYIMTSRLTGMASKWYLTSGVGTTTWQSLKSKFLQAFPSDIEYYVLLKRMMNRIKAKNETISNYFHHKMALLNACEIFGRKAVSCLIHGVTNNKIKLDAKRQNFNDPDSLYSYLRTCEFTSDEPDREEKVHVKEKKSRFQEAVISTRNTEKLIEEIPSLFKQQSVELITEAHIRDIRFRAYIDESSPTTTIREDDAIDTKLPIKRQLQTINGHGGLSIRSMGYVETSLIVDQARANVRIFVVPTNTQPFPIVLGSSFIDQHHICLVTKDKRTRILQKMDEGFTNFDH